MVEERILYGICFYDHDLTGVLEPRNDSVLIEANIKEWDLQKLIVDEGSTTCLVYANYWERMKINSRHILFSQREIIGFNIAKSKLLGHIMLHITLGIKMINQDFYLMDCKSPYNSILVEIGQTVWVLLQQVDTNVSSFL